MAKKKPRKPPSEVQAEIDTVLRTIFGGNTHSPVMVDMSSVIRRGKKFPVTLTDHQRRSLKEFCNLSRGLLKKIREAGTGKQTITVTRKELDELHDRIGEVTVHIPSAHRRRLSSLQSQVAELFAEDTRENLGRLQRNKSAAKKPPAKKSSTTIYQFKITLLDTKPKIWRRIQIPDCKLNTLHYHIQAAMGWTNRHLHHFIIGRQRYGVPKWLDDRFLGSKVVDSTKTMLSDLLPTNGKKMKFEYTYDMGDDWEHEILFEGCPKPDPTVKYPICLEGERACPPEDCGGVPGYEHLLEVLNDPGQAEYQDALHWVGDDFDPELFDPKIATVRMVRG